MKCPYCNFNLVEAPKLFCLNEKCKKPKNNQTNELMGRVREVLEWHKAGGPLKEYNKIKTIARELLAELKEGE